MIKYLLLLFLIYVIASQFFFIKEGFTAQLNSYARPKIRQLRLKKETFMAKANGHIGKVIRKIGIN